MIYGAFINIIERFMRTIGGMGADGNMHLAARSSVFRAVRFLRVDKQTIVTNGQSSGWWWGQLSVDSTSLRIVGQQYADVVKYKQTARRCPPDPHHQM